MIAELHIRKFDRAKDTKTINQWCRDWKMSEFADWWLPDTGYMVEGVLYGSLYFTNSGLAYLENIISNPDAPTELRQTALGMVGDASFQEARAAGYKAVLGWTSNKSVAGVSAEHGMQLSKFNHTVMIKLLH